MSDLARETHFGIVYNIDVSNTLQIWYIYNDLRLGFYEDITCNYHTYCIPSSKICFYKINV